uniref:Neuropeptides capa receptor-like n=1 Tax=Saccoglossus kowalevskii TaxID=10224 RepID=A0ABM0M9Q9_SACKO|nr:PREDICTED: neuropeptides capa receptor-like [Saccoglossus kowalevskii]
MAFESLSKECKLVPFLEYSAAQASVLTLVSVAIERFVAICHPLRAQYIITPSKAVRICVLIWLIACGSSIPYLFMAQHRHYDVTENGDDLYDCGTYNNSMLTEIYVIFAAVIFFLLPLIMLVGLYSRVSSTLNKKIPSQSNGRRSARRDTPTHGDYVVVMHMYTFIAEVGGSSSPYCCPRKSPIKQRGLDAIRSQMRMRKRVVYMLITVVILFFVCLLPQRVVSLWFKYGSTDQHMELGVERVYTLVIVCRILTYVNSSINPIIYNIMSSKFRDAFLRILGIGRVHGQVSEGYHSNTSRLGQTRSDISRQDNKGTRL